MKFYILFCINSCSLPISTFINSYSELFISATFRSQKQLIFCCLHWWHWRDDMKNPRLFIKYRPTNVSAVVRTSGERLRFIGLKLKRIFHQVVRVIIFILFTINVVTVTTQYLCYLSSSQTYYKNKVRWTWLQLLWPSSMELTTISYLNNNWH